MRILLRDFIQRLDQATSAEEATDALVAWSQDLGFRRVVYASMKMGRMDPPVVFGSYPEQWVKRYMEQGYGTVDPVACIGVRTVLPFRWGDAEFRKAFARPQKQLFSESAEFGICRGFSVPVHGPGGEFSLVTLATDEMDRSFHRLVDLSEDMLHIGSCYLHQRIADLTRGTAGPPPGSSILSPRETECLTWTAGGGTAAEIGDRLAIAESTVAYHLHAAKRKLGARTKGHAVARALALGLIHPA